MLVDVLGSPLIRFYYGEDLLGTEYGAREERRRARCGNALDGPDYGSLKGALMARGTRELVRPVRTRAATVRRSTAHISATTSDAFPA